MSEFVAVAKTGEIPESGKFCFELNDRFLVIARVEGQYYCLDDMCTHDGGPLGDGELEGYCLTCPRHGAQFDVRNGKAVRMPATEPTGSHAVRVEGDTIYVRVTE